MRGLRFVILLLIAIPLGWYAYRDSTKEPADDTPKHDKAFAVEADKIDELQIKSESGERTTVKKSGTDWAIVQPAPAPGDQSTISSIAQNLASAEIQRVVAESPADLKEFGLAEPRVDVTFKAGGQEHRLQLGGKAPTGSDVYAKLGDQKKVFIVGSFVDSALNKTTFDLRDKSVIKVDRDKVDALEVTTPEHTARFAKVNGEWQLTQPIAGRAEFGAVDSLISRVSALQMKSIVTPEPTDLEKLGLAKPAATIRIGSGSSLATLVVSAVQQPATVYARDLSRPAVFTIEPSLLDDLKKDPGEYRQKDLFDGRAFNTTRIELVRNGQTFAFEKTTAKNKDGQDVDKWRQVAPAPARDADTVKVEALISAAAGARATSFVDAAKTGLDKPELTVSLKYDQGKDEHVAFARAAGTAYAARSGSPGAAKLDATVIDGIVKALEDLK